MEHVKKEATCVRDAVTGQCYELVDEKARKRIEALEETTGTSEKCVTRGDSVAYGNKSRPVYVNSSGLVQECRGYAGATKVVLNGEDKGEATATLYAPTKAGSNVNKQVLLSTGEEPVWRTLILKVNGTGYAYNSDSIYLSSANFYAPLTSGTEGQILKSNGTTKAPTWVDMPVAGEVVKESVTLTSNDAVITLPDGTNRFTLVYTVADNTDAMIYIDDTILDVQLIEGTTTLDIQINIGKNSTVQLIIDSYILGEDSNRKWDVLLQLNKEGAYPISPTTSLYNFYDEEKYSSLGQINIGIPDMKYIGFHAYGYSYGPFIAFDITQEI